MGLEGADSAGFSGASVSSIITSPVPGTGATDSWRVGVLISPALTASYCSIVIDPSGTSSGTAYGGGRSLTAGAGRSAGTGRSTGAGRSGRASGGARLQSTG